MRLLTLRLDLADHALHPMHAFVAGDDRYGPTRLLQWNETGNGTNLMVFRVAGPREPYLDRIEAVDGVRSVSVASTAEGPQSGEFFLFVEDEIGPIQRDIVDAHAAESVVVVPPVVVPTPRAPPITFVGPPDPRGRLVDRLPPAVGVEVRRVTSGDAPLARPVDRLTDRQREALATAWAAGYYEEPRAASVADVAAELDRAPGTVAEHLRKAESRLVAHALGRD